MSTKKTKKEDKKTDAKVITVKPPKKAPAPKKPKAPKFKLITYTVKAIIPTGMYANIQPEVTVEAESMEVAERAVMGHIEALFAKYRVDGPQAPQTPRPVTPTAPAAPVAPKVEAPKTEAPKAQPQAPVATKTAPTSPTGPSAPTQTAEAPQGATIAMTEPFRRAKSAIESCTSHDALKLISDQIEKSVKLIDTEKVELKKMVTVKYNDITIAGSQKA